MKLTVEIEIDQAAYDAKYGPGTQWWKQYKVEDQVNPDGQIVQVLKPAAEYEFGQGKAEQALGEMIVDILHEGLWDWRNLREDGSALKVTVNGKLGCAECGKLEGHKDWCASIAGPEASEA